MNVKQLIEQLSAVPSDVEVVVWDPVCNPKDPLIPIRNITWPYCPLQIYGQPTTPLVVCLHWKGPY